MSHPVSRIRFLAFLGVLSIVACSGGNGGHHRPFAIVGAAVDKGDSAIAAAAGYMGSDVCQSCHEEIFTVWSQTLHNNSVRLSTRPGITGAAVVADANGNGQDDFRDGLDLATDPDFATFGANAPRLDFAGGSKHPHRVRIGGVTYDVWRTLGGNGLWHQLYLTMLGSTIFYLPIEYVESTRNWKPYAPEVFYDGSTPRFGSLAEARNEIDPARSFDLECAGCHSTGTNLTWDAGEGQYVTGYDEISVGCEACHGPGKEHVDSFGYVPPVNPEALLDGSVDGVLAADLVCGRCHVRGAGGIPAGGSHRSGYPWGAGGTFPPGSTDFDAYFDVTDSPADWWRYKDNPMGGATPGDFTDDTQIAARSGELQWPDLSIGVHGPNEVESPTCFSCHDPHSREGEHQIRKKVVENGIEYDGVTPDNNKLCLACHHGYGDFAGLTDADVQGVTDDYAPPAVVNAVVEHMKDRAGMPIDPDYYSPADGGTGRCVLCHQVKTAMAASYGADAAGNLVGDLHGHTFEVVWPNVTERTKAETGGAGITNGCSTCHGDYPGDDAGVIIEEWAVDGEGDGVYHADTPRSYQNGVANVNRAGGVACLSCHTTEGFVTVQVEGASIHDLTGAADAATRSDIVKRAIRRDVGITCGACHGRGPDGAFAAGANPLRFPKEELCGTCHNNQTVLYEDYQAYGELVRHPQREMVGAADGAEVVGQTYGTMVHSLLFGGDCTACHFRPGDSSREHSFAPTVEACNATGCHNGGLSSFNRLAFNDYDGDGTTEGIQDEVTGVLEILKNAVLAKVPSDPNVTVSLNANGEWLIGRGGGSPVAPARGNTYLLDATNDGPQLRAMFNHNFVRFDGSKGIHNVVYALNLLQESYVEMTGLPWPGAVK